MDIYRRICWLKPQNILIYREGDSKHPVGNRDFDQISMAEISGFTIKYSILIDNIMAKNAFNVSKKIND